MRFTILLLLLPLTVYSQQKEPDYVVVKGRAQVEIPLEYLQVSIAVSTYGSSYKAANDSNRVLVFSVLDVLKRFGIADSDFQTLNISSYENPPSAGMRVAHTPSGTTACCISALLSSTIPFSQRS